MQWNEPIYKRTQNIQCAHGSWEPGCNKQGRIIDTVHTQPKIFFTHGQLLWSIWGLLSLTPKLFTNHASRLVCRNDPKTKWPPESMHHALTLSTWLTNYSSLTSHDKCLIINYLAGALSWLCGETKSLFASFDEWQCSIVDLNSSREHVKLGNKHHTRRMMLP